MRVASRRPLCSAHNAFVPGRAVWKLFTSTPFLATPLLVQTRGTSAAATKSNPIDDVAHYSPPTVYKRQRVGLVENGDPEPFKIHRNNQRLEIRRRKLLFTMWRCSYKVYRELKDANPPVPFISDNIHFPKERQSATAVEYHGQNIAIGNNSSFEEALSSDSIPWMERVLSLPDAGAHRSYHRWVVARRLGRWTSGLTSASLLPGCATR